MKKNCNKSGKSRERRERLGVTTIGKGIKSIDRRLLNGKLHCGPRFNNVKLYKTISKKVKGIEKNPIFSGLN